MGTCHSVRVNFASFSLQCGTLTHLATNVSSMSVGSHLEAVTSENLYNAYGLEDERECHCHKSRDLWSPHKTNNKTGGKDALVPTCTARSRS